MPAPAASKLKPVRMRMFVTASMAAAPSRGVRDRYTSRSIHVRQTMAATLCPLVVEATHVESVTAEKLEAGT